MTDVKLSEEFLKDFSKIQSKAENGNGEAAYLLKLVEKGIVKLSADYRCGQQIRRNMWPNYYSKKYPFDNLWRLRLDSSWRMLYTMRGKDVDIIALVLDVIDHKEYDRRFGYQ